MSTWGKEGDTLKLDIDPKSHSAWTGGTQKILDKGRVSKYNKKFINLRSKKKNLGWLTEDEIESISKDLGVKPAEVREMEKRLSGLDMSFDPLEGDEGDDANYAPAQYLEDSSANPSEIIEKEDDSALNTTQLYDALKQLDDRSRDIIYDRWLSDEKLTLHELADKYGISAERVRQIEQNAMKKVKQNFPLD